MPLEHDLLAIEQQLWTGGPETFQRHTDDHCLVVFAEMTAVMSRAEIAKTAEQGRWRHVTCHLKGFVQPADDVAIIAYECTATRKDGQPHHALVGSAYRKRVEGWKLSFHQQTVAAARTASSASRMEP